jgi:hypothetical protein
MSNVIRFLESMGSNPALSRLSAAEYSAVVAALDVDDRQKQALQDRDAGLLNDLLGGRSKMYCAQWPAKEQPLEPDQEPDDDKQDDGDENASPAD